MEAIKLLHADLSKLHGSIRLTLNDFSLKDTAAGGIAGAVLVALSSHFGKINQILYLCNKSAGCCTLMIKTTEL